MGYKYLEGYGIFIDQKNQHFKDACYPQIE